MTCESSLSITDESFLILGPVIWSNIFVSMVGSCMMTTYADTGIKCRRIRSSISNDTMLAFKTGDIFVENIHTMRSRLNIFVQRITLIVSTAENQRLNEIDEVQGDYTSSIEVDEFEQEIWCAHLNNMDAKNKCWWWTLPLQRLNISRVKRLISSKSHNNPTSSDDFVGRIKLSWRLCGLIVELGSPMFSWLYEVMGEMSGFVLDRVYDIDWSVVDPTADDVWCVFTVDEEGRCNDMTGTGDATFGIWLVCCLLLLNRDRKYELCDIYGHLNCNIRMWCMTWLSHIRN